ncbi:Heat shock protein beta-1 [Goodea atripinnis]|uniref:Heat shock protein beta-1 n=1 Tax=Goodea atripinnis TaxID=208336 RepID=A0ABV0N762_9TELE
MDRPPVRFYFHAASTPNRGSSTFQDILGVCAATMAERRIPFTMQRTPSWDPFHDLHHTTRIFDQAFGLPPVVEDFPTFPTTHWPGYMRPSFMGPDIMMPQSHMMYHPSHMMAHQARALSRQMSSGMSEIKQTQDNWKISLDVPHFSPEELVVKTKDGVLEISGEHFFLFHCLC